MADEVTIVVRAEDQFSNVLGNFGNIITGIKSALDLLSSAFDAVVSPLIDFGRESVNAAARVEVLGVVNKILAENAGIAAATIPPLVEAIRAQGIEAAVAEGVVSSFIKANLDLALAVDLARVAQDAAVISGMNSSETLDNIIYGITTLNPLVLRHAGIVVDLQLAYKEWADENDRKIESLTTEEKQMIALNAVMEYGIQLTGSYAASQELAGKQLTSFTRYINDIYVAVGQYFLPAFTDMVFATADFLKWLGQAVKEGGLLAPIIQSIADKVNFMAEVFGIAMDVAIDFLDILSGGDTSLGGTLYDLGIAINDMNIPALYELGTALFDLGIALKTGDETPWLAFLNFLKDLSDNGGPLSGIAQFLIDIRSEFIHLQSVFEESGFAAAVKEVFSNIPWDEIWATIGEGLSALDTAIADWLDSVDWEAVGSEIGQLVVMLFDLLGTEIETSSGKSQTAAALRRALVDVIVAAFTELEVSGTDAMRNFWNELEVNISNAFRDGLNSIEIGIADWVRDHIITPIKQILGISSPSTVFMEIGKNIVLGLIAGVASMLGLLSATITGILAALLAPLEPIFNLLGIDISGLLGTSSTTTGTTGSHDTGGVTTPSGGVLTGAGNITNNFYAPVYFGDLGQLGYDCPSPHPLLAASQGSLLTSVTVG